MLSFELVLTSKSNQDFLIHSGADFETKKCGMSRFHKYRASKFQTEILSTFVN